MPKTSTCSPPFPATISTKAVSVDIAVPPLDNEKLDALFAKSADEVTPLKVVLEKIKIFGIDPPPALVISKEPP